jgi:hypothetical protein
MRSYFLLVIVLILLGCSKNTISSDYQIFPNGNDKVWAHRVNTLKNNKARILEFKGIEIDVFYLPNSDSFRVKHDLDQEGVLLSAFLDSLIVENDRTPIWIDYKNLNIDTEKGVDKLVEILKNRGLQNHCFVESYYLEALKKFKGKLVISYWMSLPELPDNKKGRDSIYNKYLINLDLSAIDMISGPHTSFEFFNEYFPGKKANYWMTGMLSDKHIKRLHTMISDKQTNIVLIGEKKHPLND